MTISTNDRRRRYVATGLTDTFNGPMAYQAETIRVSTQVDGVVTDLPSNAYSVSNLARSAGTRVKLATMPPNGAIVLILRVVPYTQNVDITNQGAFLPETVEKGYDETVFQTQQLADKINLSLRVADNFTGEVPDMILPEPEPSAVLGWNVAGSGIRNVNIDPNAAGDLLLRSDLADPTGGANLVKFKQLGLASKARTVLDKMYDTVSAFDFMSAAEIADVRAGTMLYDVTSAINSAISSSLIYSNATRVYLPPGTYRVDGTILMRNNGSALIGAGRQATILKSTLTTNPMITFTNGINNAEIRDLWLDRVTPGTGGGFGIDAGVAILGESIISNVRVTRMSIGMSLGCTDHSIVKDCIVSKNTSHGIRIYNSSANASQWSIDGLLSQTNDGYGVLVVTLPGMLPAMSVGSFRNVNTFANTLGGIWVLGSASCSVEGFRLDGFFVGEEGNDGVFLDTYNHIPCTIRNGYAEIVGRNFTGSSFSTPASMVGRGVHVSANNAHVDITNVIATGNSFDGILVECNSAALTGCSAISNGASSNPTASAGIRAGGTCLLTVSGGKSGNTPATANTQTYGVFVDNGAYASVLGVDLTSNVTSTHGANADVNSMMVIGCLGALENRLPYLSIGAAAATPAGTVNVATGISLNGVAYTNP